jgi:hypothetical protein
MSTVAAADGVSTRTRTSADHSAFFNGAGYQEDVPVRVGPTTRTRVHTRPCHPHGHHHSTCWSSSVRAYWVPGYYQWTTQRVWVAPTWTTEYVPPVYQYGYHQSRQVQILVREGYYQKVQVPGHWEQRPVQVWVEGYWSYY